MATNLGSFDWLAEQLVPQSGVNVQRLGRALGRRPVRVTPLGAGGKRHNVVRAVMKHDRQRAGAEKRHGVAGGLDQHKTRVRSSVATGTVINSRVLVEQVQSGFVESKDVVGLLISIQ